MGDFTGPAAGSLPNVHWRALSMQALRKDPAFEALPPVEDISLATPQCYRCTLRSPCSMMTWLCLHVAPCSLAAAKAVAGQWRHACCVG